MSYGGDGSPRPFQLDADSPRTQDYYDHSYKQHHVETRYSKNGDMVVEVEFDQNQDQLDSKRQDLYGGLYNSGMTEDFKEQEKPDIVEIEIEESPKAETPMQPRIDSREWENLARSHGSNFVPAPKPREDQPKELPYSIRNYPQQEPAPPAPKPAPPAPKPREDQLPYPIRNYPEQEIVHEEEYVRHSNKEEKHEYTVNQGDVYEVNQGNVYEEKVPMVRKQSQKSRKSGGHRSSASYVVQQERSKLQDYYNDEKPSGNFHQKLMANNRSTPPSPRRNDTGSFNGIQKKGGYIDLGNKPQGRDPVVHGHYDQEELEEEKQGFFGGLISSFMTDIFGAEKTKQRVYTAPLPKGSTNSSKVLSLNSHGTAYFGSRLHPSSTGLKTAAQKKREDEESGYPTMFTSIYRSWNQDSTARNFHITHNGHHGLEYHEFTGFDPSTSKIMKEPTETDIRSNEFRAYVAAKDGHPWELQSLIEKYGVNPNETDSDDMTLLDWSCRMGHADCVAVLLKKGAYSDQSGLNKYTPLSWAAKFGNDEVIQVLLAHGVPVDETDGMNHTALMYACANGHTDCAQILLSAGADPNALARVDNTEMLEKMKKIDNHFQYRRGVRENLDWEELSEGKTPIHIAARHNHYEIVEILYRYGADVSARDDRGFTAMYWAAIFGHLEAIDVLVGRCDANIDLPDYDGNTPLMWAVRLSSDDAVRFLILYEANIHWHAPNAPSRNAWTWSLQYAKPSTEQIIKECLEYKGVPAHKFYNYNFNLYSDSRPAHQEQYHTMGTVYTHYLLHELGGSSAGANSPNKNSPKTQFQSNQVQSTIINSKLEKSHSQQFEKSRSQQFEKSRSQQFEKSHSQSFVVTQ